MKILHIDCSTRALSYSRRLSGAIVERLRADDTQAVVIRRDLGWVPIPHTGMDYAESLSSPTAIVAKDAHQLSEELIAELEAADVVVIGTPMHNFTLPSVLKAWIDQVLRVGRTIIPTPTGKVGALPDRPVFIAIASGGVFDGERANQPDLLTPYLTAALGCIGLTSLHFLPLQATAFTDDEHLMEKLATLIKGFELMPGSTEKNPHFPQETAI